MPGAQTVPRAELWAACMVAEMIPNGNGATIKADADYVVKGMSEHPRQAKLRRGRNGGLWSRLLDGLASRSSTLEATKVKAHIDPADAIRGKGDVADYLGNHVADAAAGAVAERHLR